jgi:hypothetical protein
LIVVAWVQTTSAGGPHRRPAVPRIVRPEPRHSLDRTDTARPIPCRPE